MILKASRKVVLEITKVELVVLLKAAYPSDLNVQTLRGDGGSFMEVPTGTQFIRLTSHTVPKDIETNDSTPGAAG